MRPLQGIVIYLGRRNHQTSKSGQAQTEWLIRHLLFDPRFRTKPIPVEVSLVDPVETAALKPLLHLCARFRVLSADQAGNSCEPSGVSSPASSVRKFMSRSGANIWGAPPRVVSRIIRTFIVAGRRPARTQAVAFSSLWSLSKSMDKYLLVDHSEPAMCLSRAAARFSADWPSGKEPTTRVRRLIVNRLRTVDQDRLRRVDHPSG